MTSVISLVTLVLTLLNRFVEWGARSKVFKEDEALIAVEVLKRVTKEISDANETRKAIRDRFDNDPTSIMQPDEHTRPSEDKRPGT